MQFEQADIVLVADDNCLSKAIRWAQKEPNEEAVVSHVGMIVYPTKFQMLYQRAYERPVRGPLAVEALWSVVCRPLEEMIADHQRVWIAHHTKLAKTQRDVIANYALLQVGSPYSLRRLFAHGALRVFGAKWAKRLPITELDCSVLVAAGYFLVGVLFGRLPREVTPDDIWDHVIRSPLWEVYEVKNTTAEVTNTDCEE